MRKNFALIGIVLFFITGFTMPSAAQSTTLCVRKSLKFAWVRNLPSPDAGILTTTTPADCARRPMQWVNLNVAWDSTQTWVQVNIQVPDSQQVLDSSTTLITGWVELSSVIDAVGRPLPTPTGLPPVQSASCPRNAAVVSTRYNGGTAGLIWSDGLVEDNSLSSGLPVRNYHLKGVNNTLLSVAWSPDGSHLLAGSERGVVQEWDANTGELLWAMPDHPLDLTSVAWSPDGKTFLTAGGRVQLWDANKRTVLRVLQEQTGGPAITSVAWSPDSKLVLIGSTADTAQVFDVNTGMSVQSLSGQSNGVWSAAWSPDGKMLLTTDQAGVIHLWEASTGKLLNSFQGHQGIIRSLAWSPDGELALSGGDDYTARVWKPSTGELLYTLHGHKKVIWNVEWARDGKTALTGGLDGVALLWEVSTGKLLRPLCSN